MHPNHVAFIVDGNRRWAREQQMVFFDAYKVAGTILVENVCAAAAWDIRNVTAFLFSTENWKRDRDEIDAVMTAFTEILYENTNIFKQSGVRVHAIGKLNQLPPAVQDAIAHTRAATRACTKTNFVLAFNYGGRWDILNAARCFMERNGTQAHDVTEQQFSAQLSTAPFGDPDLLIRTGNQQRVSNFLMWQLAYTELYFSDLMWPDFSPEHFEHALRDYAHRQRRHGGG